MTKCRFFFIKLNQVLSVTREKVVLVSLVMPEMLAILVHLVCMVYLDYVVLLDCKANMDSRENEVHKVNCNLKLFNHQFLSNSV